EQHGDVAVVGAGCAQLPLARRDLLVEEVDQPQARLGRLLPRLGQLKAREQRAPALAEQIARRVRDTVGDQGGVDAVLQRPPVLDQVQAEAGGCVEVGELADLVHLRLPRLPAELAPPCQEPTNQLAAAGGVPNWFAVLWDRVLLPSERDLTERCDQ